MNIFRTSLALHAVVLAVAAGVAGGAAAFNEPASVPPLPQRERAVREDVIRFVDRFAADMQKPHSQPTVRELTHWAHAALALGMDPAKAEAMIRRAMALQEMDPSSKGYGTVMWQEGRPEIKDPNSIEFTMCPMGPILLRYAGKLSPTFKADMIPHVKAALVAIDRHRVSVEYTNIYLMKLVNLILLGQAIGDESAQQSGVANLDTWLSFTRQNGVTEYDSPTYSQVQLDMLGEGLIYAASPQVRGKFAAALNYLRSDMAANYFAARQTLSGPHSRTYQWATGDGIIDRFYVLSGISDALSQQGTGKFGSAGLSDATRPYLNLLEGEPPADASIVALSRVDERIVQSKFGPEVGRDRYNYITPDFAIGSVSAFYCAHDSEMTIELASPAGRPRLPIVSVLSDDQDAPYGEPLLQRDGHRKPQHLKDAMAVVQDHGTMLALLDAAPGVRETTQSSVATNVVLPMAAEEITLDGQPVRFESDHVDLPAKVGCVVGVRNGTAAAAIRFFCADGEAGSAASMHLKWDGNSYGLARLVAYHYQGPPRKLGREPLRAGLLLMARHCDSADDFHSWVAQVAKLPIEQQEEDHRWSVTTHCLASDGNGAKLHAVLDLKREEPAERTVDGRDMAAVDGLVINGRDLSSSLR